MVIRLYIVAPVNGHTTIPDFGDSVQITNHGEVTWFPDTAEVREIQGHADNLSGPSWICSVDFEASYEISSNLNKTAPIFAQFIFARAGNTPYTPTETELHINKDWPFKAGLWQHGNQT